MTEQPPRTAHEGHLTSAIYGSLLVVGILAALDHEHASARTVALTLVANALTFWLAHVWSTAIGERGETGRLLGWTRIRQIVASEWPIVEAVALPSLAMALAWAAVYSAAIGRDVAFGIAIAQLVGWGAVVGHRVDVSWWRALLLGAADGALGLLIIVLEVTIH